MYLAYFRRTIQDDCEHVQSNTTELINFHFVIGIMQCYLYLFIMYFYMRCCIIVFILFLEFIIIEGTIVFVGCCNQKIYIGGYLF